MRGRGTVALCVKRIWLPADFVVPPPSVHWAFISVHACTIANASARTNARMCCLMRGQGILCESCINSHVCIRLKRVTQRIKSRSAFLWSLQTRSSPYSTHPRRDAHFYVTITKQGQECRAPTSHPVIQLMHPIFGYIARDALFHLSSLHSPIQTSFPSHHALLLNLNLWQSNGDHQNSLGSKIRGVISCRWVKRVSQRYFDLSQLLKLEQSYAVSLQPFFSPTIAYFSSNIPLQLLYSCSCWPDLWNTLNWKILDSLVATCCVLLRWVTVDTAYTDVITHNAKAARWRNKRRALIKKQIDGGHKTQEAGGDGWENEGTTESYRN